MIIERLVPMQRRRPEQEPLMSLDIQIADSLTEDQVHDLVQLYQSEWWTGARGVAAEQTPSSPTPGPDIVG